ncbi:MAG: hypothetical protein JST84_04910 [Acidobacteria bacterium]|nr:hypothetical protein [Acidobacteriota bacterium]
MFQIIPSEDGRYSNTVELYDALPKYVWSRVMQKGRLDAIRREFVFRNRAYRIRVVPANLEGAKGESVDRFPREREEHVEDALRLLAARGQGVFLDEAAAVVFTLYELQQELKRLGHSYSYPEIKEAILVLRGTSIEVATADGTKVVHSNLFETVGFDEVDETGKRTKAFVRFNVLVTRSIMAGQFQPLNLEIAARIRTIIGRHLYKRMSHLFRQASLINPYTILASTIIRDFGIKSYSNFRFNLREIREALQELVQANVLLGWKEEEITTLHRHQKKLTDVKFTLTTSPQFNQDMKAGNARMLKIERLK